MKFGSLNMKSCNDCPAYTWRGESISLADWGCRCAFGAFNVTHEEVKQIPPSCPIRRLRDEVKVVVGNS